MSSDTSIPQGYKRCSKCGEVKAVEGFSKDKAKKDGLQSVCKACQVLVIRQYRQANLEKERERVRQYRQANPEKAREHNLRSYQANSERKREYQRRWREVNPEKARERKRQSYQRNPENVRQRSRQRRARIKGIVHAVPINIESILFDVQNGHCMYCQCELLNGYHLDHIVPLAMADVLGKDYPGHIPTNLCLACEYCNESKHSALLEDWLTWKYPNQVDEILHRVERHIEIMRGWE